MYIIAGCNGAGKTTACYTLLPELLECREFVNSDEFSKALSPFNPSAAAITASRYMLQKIYYLLERNMESVLLYRWLIRPAFAISRVKARVEAGGHNISDEVVRRRYFMGLDYFFRIYMPICDRWVLADNTKSPFVVVAEGNGKLTYIKDNEKYNHIWNLVHKDGE